jgi:hypothetical protein
MDRERLLILDADPRCPEVLAGSPPFKGGIRELRLHG